MDDSEAATTIPALRTPQRPRIIITKLNKIAITVIKRPGAIVISMS